MARRESAYHPSPYDILTDGETAIVSIRSNVEPVEHDGGFDTYAYDERVLRVPYTDGLEKRLADGAGEWPEAADA